MLKISDVSNWCTAHKQKCMVESSHFFLNICRGVSVFFALIQEDCVCIIYQLLSNFLQLTSLCVNNERILLY